MKFSEIRIDVAGAEAGDWVDIPGDAFPGMEGVRLKVRGIGNADYRRLQGKGLRSIAAKKLNAEKEQAAAEKLSNDLLHQTVLIGWEGISQEDDTPLAFTPELAAELIGNPEYRIFRDAVIYAGSQIANRKKEERATAEKN